MYVHNPRIERLLARLFGGVTPEITLTDDDMALLKPAVTAAQRSIIWRLVSCWIGLAALAGLVLFLTMRLDGPTVDPIVDNRLFWRSMGVAVVGIGALGVVGLALRPLLVRRAMGQDAELFDRYMATRERWLPKRAMIFWSVLSTPMVLLGLAGVLWLGDRIDANGILGAEGLIPQRHSYDLVTSIELYSALVVPIGLRQVPNLLVRFRDGSRYSYMPDQDRRLARPDAVAAYISARAKMPVTVGAVRPK
jgi:hypothetical protein